MYSKEGKEFQNIHTRMFSYSPLTMDITHVGQFYHKPPQHISLSIHKYTMKTPDNLAVLKHGFPLKNAQDV